MITLRGNIFTTEGEFRYGEVICDNGIILSVELRDGFRSECDYIIPGLVDIHSHGCAGYDVCTADMEGLEAIVTYQKEHGITSYFPTTMSLPEKTLSDVCKRIDLFGQYEFEYKNIIKGIYIEGPFISKEKAGSQKKDYIQKADLEMLDRLMDLSGNKIKMVAVAPEIEDAMEFIGSGKYACAIAHTAADYNTTKKAIQSGAKHVTHLYNAMTPMTHREPGVVGAVFDSDEVTVELICDGIHVDPSVVRTTWKLFGPDRIVLVSDSMEATGLTDGEYMLGEQQVFVKNHKATLEDGTLAGSATNLYDCMVNAVSMGIELEKVVRAATVNPAKVMGIYNHTGSIEVGKAADILVVSKDLKLKEVHFEGEAS